MRYYGDNDTVALTGSFDIFIKTSVAFILNEQILLFQTENCTVKHVATIFIWIKAWFFYSRKYLKGEHRRWINLVIMR